MFILYNITYDVIILYKGIINYTYYYIYKEIQDLVSLTNCI